MSTFVSRYQQELSLKVVPPPATSRPPTPGPGIAGHSSQVASHTKETLRSYFLELDPPKTLESARKCLITLQEIESDRDSLTGTTDEEELTLRRAILGKLVVGLYVQCLSTFLEEAASADTELDWWSDVVSSRLSIAYYLLQTLPSRLVDLSTTILRTLRSQGLPIHPSVFTPSSIRRLFPSDNVLRPTALAISFFPYLRYQPYSITLATVPFPSTLNRPTSLREEAKTTIQGYLTYLSNISQTISSLVLLPLQLIRGECNFKRKELEKVRNERAEVLGALVDMRSLLVAALENSSHDQGSEKLALFANQMQALVRGDIPSGNPTTSQATLLSLYGFTYTTFPSHISTHSSHLFTRELLRPSRLTLLWPKIVFLPPLALYLIRAMYNSRGSLDHTARETWTTLKSFWEGWLVGPIKDVIRTVRATDEEGVIVTRASVKADLESLERMTLDLAKDKLNYTPEQMDLLAAKIRTGDLTTVMQIYEEDIKNPLRSAVGGTLLRGLFVQVQKAKVDIDQALSGIDKLLKSQELTFAFVGVAPAFGIVYSAFGFLYSIYAGGKGRGLYGGTQRKTRVWLAIRRIERLLIAQPRRPISDHKHSEPSSDAVPSRTNDFSSSGIPPLTSGLLLLSVTHLRRYAESYLPTNSRLREGFLEDIADLENPAFGRAEKLRVVDRMWKSWGDALGWKVVGV